MINTFRVIGKNRGRINRIVSLAPSFTDSLAFLEQEAKL
jgi:hypothetical protein